MKEIINYLSQGDVVSWENLFLKKMSQTSAAVTTALKNGEFYGPGGSREEFITWMAGQEPQREKGKWENMTINEFYDAHDTWEKEYTMCCKNHLLSPIYFDAYKEYRIGAYEKIITPNRLYREKIVEYVEQHYKQRLFEIKRCQQITEDLINKNQIKQSPEGIEMDGLGFEMLNKSVHDDLVRKSFPDQYQEKTYDDHAGSRINLEVYKNAVDRFIKDKKSFGKGIDIGNKKEHLNKMLAWIAKKYNVNDKRIKFNILQMINPDLYGVHWMKNSRGNRRQYLNLERYMSNWIVDECYGPDSKCGLFLIKNLTYTDTKKQ